MRALLVLFVAASGCFNAGRAFDCGADDTRCRPGERCLTGIGGTFCAGPDMTCMGGFRFTSTAGKLADACLNDAPDGGVRCARAGDPCDDADPCTVDDKCQDATTCKGSPKMCPADTCSLAIRSTQTCDKATGSCIATNTPCAPFLCAGTQCATTCTTIADCQPGNYCASGKCLSCGDYLSNSSYVPTFAPATPIPGASAMNAADTSPFLSPDGLTLYFASDRAGGQGGFDLWQATRPIGDSKTPFANLKNISDLNKMGDELDPISLDGKTVTFASDRDQAGDFNLLSSSYSNGQWSFPDPIPGGTQQNPINSTGRDLHPSFTGDARRLYFQSDRAFVGVGDPLTRLFLATRAGAIDPFGSADPLSGIDPLPAWTSPSVAKSGTALFLVNAAIPTRPQAALLHLDGSGLPSGTAHVLANVDLSGGGNLHVSADGCMLLFSNRATDPAGDLLWTVRSGLVSCAAAVCGMDDSCCPPACSGFADADCATPKTWEVDEYYSMADDNHDYLLLGEKPPAGYNPTGATFRVFADKVQGSVALTRYANASSCDGKLYTYLANGNEMPRMGFAKERDLGYVIAPNIVRGTSKLYRAFKESGGCDEQITFNQKTCDDLMNQKGYTCDPLLGFAVKP